MCTIIGLDIEAIAKACEDAAQDEVVSQLTSIHPGQVVIAGNKAAVRACWCTYVKEAGAKRALPLPVSVLPSHCALMKPAADNLAVALEALEFNAPALPVINNVDVIAGNRPCKN